MKRTKIFSDETAVEEADRTGEMPMSFGLIVAGTMPEMSVEEADPIVSFILDRLDTLQDDLVARGYAVRFQHAGFRLESNGTPT